MTSQKLFYLVLLALDIVILLSLLKVGPHLKVSFLDVGQGDSILVTTAEQNHILVDGGGGRTLLTSLPEALPYLFNEIDLMVLTHPHDDHIQGLIPLLDRLRVNAVLLSAPSYKSEAYDVFLEKIRALNVPVFFAEAGTDFKFGDTIIDVLYPFKQVNGIMFENVNNSSVVLRIFDDEYSVLLTGDADESVEAMLVNSYAGDDGGGISRLDSDIFKAGHHGSKYSNTEAFLRMVSPEEIVVSVGVDNDYGHPHEEFLETAKKLGIPVSRTDLYGTVQIIFDGSGGGLFYSFIRSIFAPSLRSFSSSFS